MKAPIAYCNVSFLMEVLRLYNHPRGYVALARSCGVMMFPNRSWENGNWPLDPGVTHYQDYLE